MSVVPLSSLVSHPGVPEDMRAARRLDPFWDGLWSRDNVHKWFNQKILRTQAELLGGRSPLLSLTQEDAWRRVLEGGMFRPTRLALLGALAAWHTFTVEQAVALTGHRPLLSASGDEVKALFTARLMEYGELMAVVDSIDPQVALRARMLRPPRVSSLADELLPTLTYPEAFTVTGGHSIKTTGQFPRHNSLAVELALRAAEYCDVSTVLGEPFSTVELLLGSGIGRSDPDLVNYRKAGDATLVRSDGLRIVTELTASTSRTFRLKVEEWARFLSRSSLAASGVVVVFVVAKPPDSESNSLTLLQVRKAIIEAVNKYRFRDKDGVTTADRIGMAVWEDWFPAPHMAASDFTSLPVFFSSPGGWRRRHVMDLFDYPFNPNDPSWMQAVAANASVLGQTPHWLRGGDLEMSDVDLRSAGIPDPPMLVPDDERRMPAFERLVANGWDKKLPPRLRSHPDH